MPVMASQEAIGGQRAETWFGRTWAVRLTNAISLGSFLVMFVYLGAVFAGRINDRYLVFSLVFLAAGQLAMAAGCFAAVALNDRGRFLSPPRMSDEWVLRNGSRWLKIAAMELALVAVALVALLVRGPS